MKARLNRYINILKGLCNILPFTVNKGKTHTVTLQFCCVDSIL